MRIILGVVSSTKKRLSVHHRGVELVCYVFNYVTQLPQTIIDNIICTE